MKTNIDRFLTPKQKLFCDEYLTDMNATRAALRAGYSSATALNGQLMQMAKIKMYLQMRAEEGAARSRFTQDMVLQELGKIAFGNMSNYFGAGGSIKPMHELNDDEKAALWSVSVSDVGSGASAGVVTKFRMYNKLSALEKIAKYLNLYKQEEKKQQPVYVYLSEAQMNEQDWFEDRRAEEQFNPQAKPEEPVAAKAEPVEEPVPPVVDEDNVLRDSAGIAYEPHVKKKNFYLDLNETPQQLLARLKLEEGGELRADITTVDFRGKPMPPVREPVPFGRQVRAEIERDRRLGIKGRYV